MGLSAQNGGVQTARPEISTGGTAEQQMRGENKTQQKGETIPSVVLNTYDNLQLWGED